MIRLEIFHHLLQQPQTKAPSQTPSVKESSLAQLLTPPPTQESLHLKSYTFSQALKSLSFLDTPANSVIQSGVSESMRHAIEGFPGLHWAEKLASNGNRESAVLVPPSTDLNQPIEVITYFHGHSGTVSKSLTHSSKGIQNELLNLAKESQRNLVFVMPQGPPKNKDYTWMNPRNSESIQDFQNNTETILKELNQGQPIAVKKRTVIGHSAGGLPILNGAKDGLKADKIVFFDASYGSWAKRAYEAQEQTNPDLDMQVIYRPETKTEKGAKVLKGKVQLTLTSISHGRIPKAFIEGL